MQSLVVHLVSLGAVNEVELVSCISLEGLSLFRLRILGDKIVEEQLDILELAALGFRLQILSLLGVEGLDSLLLEQHL